MQKITLASQLSEVRGMGLRFFIKFKRLGIVNARDLLRHFPTRYEDWSEISTIAELKPGDSKTIKGVVQEIGLKRTWQKRMFIVEALISDESGSIKAIWFNQPYIKNVLKKGVTANFAGKASFSKNGAYLSNPAYEIENKNSAETKHTARLVPIYPETKGLTSKGIRYFTEFVLHNLEPIKEFMPIEILRQNGLPEVNVALRAIHLPHNITEAENARRRFAFEELFLLQLKNIYQKAELAKERAPSICIKNGFVHQILSGLPFKLTESQNKSLGEILHGLSRSQPMNRLLQGDVGSGKTIVAGIAAIAAASDDYQIALMAPTEILARQHYRTLMKFFAGFDGGIGLFVSKEARTFYGDGLETPLKRPSFISDIAKNKIKIIIGTHALIQKPINFKNLGFVIIDEQHRFGVKQRAELSKNTELVPHFLSMSATPIPRTLMMTIFGDLDLSIINELPKGRKNIITKIVDPINRDKAYAFIRGQAGHGRQVFVICPRIEVEDESTTKMELEKLEIKSVKEEYEKLSKRIFPDLRVAMLHGKMKAKEKEIIMNEFVNGDVDILISTSVVEVGVDVPNATIMLIEGAERFGLAQLYQFRGRVGRGKHQSFCFLFSESGTISVHKRLESLLTAKNGFELAEYDLAIRGPGQFLGEEQAGMPDVAMRALKDPNLVKGTRMAAEKIMENDPSLDKHQSLKLRLSQFKKEIHLE